ncbi:MAG: AAA family ATPase [Candidatus Lindowbacteria bacterium RIFCSPLOWO2_12_FULL_62_27]|nr:MAG: AAA family ATPase [Candidatus Lindowbacteria bacterium RIFCSPLOWO2_12_FULL_62_27]
MIEAKSTIAEFRSRLKSAVGRRIVGQEEVLDQMTVALIAGGHVLLIGVPGLAKTLMVQSLASACDLSFSRIQFTPDLMPSDIIGTEILVEDADRRREFRFQRGPVFHSIILADEINRTPPKTQAALLEAMQERKITVAGTDHPLPDPFFVLATQNPIEQEGTYPLPEAQLDRFLFSIRVGYPGEEEEKLVLTRESAPADAPIQPVVSLEEIKHFQRQAREILVADSLVTAVVRMLRESRPEGSSIPEVRRHVRLGVGTRAGTFLLMAAKARALLADRPHVTPEDLRAVAPPVLSHRLLMDFTAEAEGVRSAQLIDRLLDLLA